MRSGAAMKAAAAPEELNRVSFRIYEAFRPEIPPGAAAWGNKGDLVIKRIAAAAREH